MNIYMIEKEKKNAYLESIKLKNEPKTYELYSKLIDKLDEFEDYKGVHATNMTKLDFMEFLTSLSSSSLSVLYTYKSAINSYLMFATDKQNFTLGLLELDKITQDDLLECINKNAELMQFITEKEYYDIITSNIGNYQDKLVVILLWNKIKGEKTFDDILNLKINDVNFDNNSIYVKSKNRMVCLSDIEMDIVKKAIDENVYIRTTVNKKGEIKEALVYYLTGDTEDSFDNGYLIKATEGSTNKQAETNQCTYGTFANRMSKYYTLVLQRSGLTNQRIYKSSVYYHMLKEYGRKLTLGELMEYLEYHDEKVSLSNTYREQDIMFKKIREQGEI